MLTVSGSGRNRPHWLLTGLCLWCWVATAAAQAPLSLPNPRLSWAFPAGGQVGTTFEVVVSGADVVDASELIFSHPGITAKRKMAEPGLGQTESQPVDGTFLVSIAADVPQDVYELRVQSKFGLTNPRFFAVGLLKEVRESEPNQLPEQANEVALETTINGTCDLATLDYFKFTAKQGQRVIIDCEAFRIDSRLDGTLVLYDATGRELERSHNVNRRDPLIDFTVPQDGQYLFSIQDQSRNYRLLTAEAFYRVTISTLPHIDFIYPPVGQPGSSSQYTVYGRNLPGGKPAPGIEVGGKTLEQLTVNIPLPADRSRDLVRSGGLLVEPSESFLDGISFRLPSPRGFSNPLLLTTTSLPIVLEQEPNNRPAEAPVLSVPCEYVGQLFPTGDRDWVSFQAKRDDVFWIDLICQRLGNSTDPRMVIQQVKRDAKGQEQIVHLKTVDDDLANAERVHWSMLDSILYSLNSYDPVYRFVAPEDGTYRIMLQDLSRPNQDLARLAKGDARFTYRLAIRPADPDFRLVAVPRPPTNQPAETTFQGMSWSSVLRQGGTDMIEVFVHRRDGFEGEIMVTADQLPAGVTAAPIVIGPKEVSATMILKAADDAPAGYSNLRIQGTSRIGQNEVVRQVRPATMNWVMQEIGVTYHRSRLTDQFAVSVISNEQPPFSVVLDPDLSFEALVYGTFKFPVRVIRRGNFQGPLDLFVYGLPASINGPMHAQPKYHTPITIPANQDSIEFTVTIPGYVPPGTYSFFISGLGTVSYAMNPEKLVQAEGRLATIEKIVTDNDTKLKAALEIQAAAAKALADAQAANQNVPAATEAKVAADKAVSEADTKAKKDAAFLATFRQEITQLKTQCKPTDIKISTASNRATLKMPAAPFEFAIAAENLSIKSGAKVELPVTIKRLYGNNDPVHVHFQGANTISGILAPAVTVPANQSDGRVTIEATAAAVPGRYRTTVQSSMNYKGQILTVLRDLVLTIEAPEPSTK